MDKNNSELTESLNQQNNNIIVPVPEEEKKKLTFLEVLGKLSPGKSLRTALGDILEGKLGALIAVDCPELRNIIEGGFRISCSFTHQRLAELAKMDGAIILSEDMRRILFANVLLVPDSEIQTNETGTRHKAAERTAKQTGTIVIAVSERRNKITLFYEDKKYILENSENLLRKATETLNILEKQREIFEENIKNFNVLEITGLVSVGDICNVLQRIEFIVKMMDTMKRYLIELGNHGIIIRMRVKEMFGGVEALESDILRDYSNKPLNVKRILSSMNFDSVPDMEVLSRMLFEASPESQLNPKGFRILEKLNLTEREVKFLVSSFNNLAGIMNAGEGDISKILKAKTGFAY
jgi:diadenylate cyclase